MIAFPVDTADDVTAPVELLGRAAADKRLRSDLGDHFAYVAGTHPEWFRPHQETIVTEFIDGFDVSFEALAVCVSEFYSRHLWGGRGLWSAAFSASTDCVRDCPVFG